MAARAARGRSRRRRSIAEGAPDPLRPPPKPAFRHGSCMFLVVKAAHSDDIHSAHRPAPFNKIGRALV